MSLSVVINTKNAVSSNFDHKFADTLKSVKFADEIIVVDMQSSDETIKVAKKYTDRIFAFADVGLVEPARNFAISKATQEWVLIVDADEIISPTLRKRIQALVGGDATADAYFLPRKNIVFKRWYEHAGWWPDYQLRLFRKDVVTWSDRIHSQPRIKGTADYLAKREDYAIIHYNYQTVEQYIERLNRYTSHEARQREQKNITGGTIIESFNAEAMSRLFLHRGVDAGTHGVGISLLQAFYEVAVVLKQWELQGFPKSDNKNDAIKELEELQFTLNFWLADWHARNNKGIAKLIWRLRRKLGL